MHYPDGSVEGQFNVKLFFTLKKCATMNPQRRKGPIATAQMSSRMALLLRVATKVLIVVWNSMRL